MVGRDLRREIGGGFGEGYAVRGRDGMLRYSWVVGMNRRVGGRCHSCGVQNFCGSNHAGWDPLVQRTHTTPTLSPSLAQGTISFGNPLPLLVLITVLEPLIFFGACDFLELWSQ